MNSTSPNRSKNGRDAEHREEAVIIERIKKKAHVKRLRAAQELAARLQIAPDGSKTFIRFNQNQRLEHQILIITFSILGITGLLQRYSSMALVGWIINVIFGGVETLRTLHHLAAVAFIIETLYHLVQIMLVWFVKRKRGAMWPSIQDFKDLMQMVKYNLGRAEKKPKFGRFSIEEKVEYWALLWGTLVMIITGLIQWFPTLITTFLPGDAIPVSRSIHGWEAVLAILSILIWHMYHTVVKEKNKSIFTGTMSENEMLETHPLEYQQIIGAYDYLQKRKTETPPVNSKDGKHEIVQETQTS